MLSRGHSQNHSKLHSSNRFTVFLLWFERCPPPPVQWCWELGPVSDGEEAGDLSSKRPLELRGREGAVQGGDRRENQPLRK